MLSFSAKFIVKTTRICNNMKFLQIKDMQSFDSFNQINLLFYQNLSFSIFFYISWLFLTVQPSKANPSTQSSTTVMTTITPTTGTTPRKYNPCRTVQITDIILFIKNHYLN